jgi:hypothetical protein
VRATRRESTLSSNINGGKMDKINAKRAAFMLGIIISGRESYDYKLNNVVCKYFDQNGCPSCIVGHVLDKAGLKIANGSAENTTRFQTLGIAKDNFTENAIRLLRIAQLRQDAGSTWGAAVKEALDNVDDENYTVW